jgi:hypothetical protein
LIVCDYGFCALWAQRVLKFDGACGAEGCGITAFGGDEFYMPLRGGRYEIIFRSLAILSRRQRILVREDSVSFAGKYRSAGRLSLSS